MNLHRKRQTQNHGNPFSKPTPGVRTSGINCLRCRSSAPRSGPPETDPEWVYWLTYITVSLRYKWLATLEILVGLALQRYDKCWEEQIKEQYKSKPKEQKPTERTNTEEINSELANPFKNTNRAEREQAKTAPQIYCPLGFLGTPGNARMDKRALRKWRGFQKQSTYTSNLHWISFAYGI